MNTLPFAISIPHGGTEVPTEFKHLVIATPDCLKEDADHLTQEICTVPEGMVEHVLTFSTSRTYVDLNRPPDAYGVDHPDGVVKRKTHLNKDVFREFPADDVVEAVLERLYHPYHRQLQEVTCDPKVALTLDCHSMSPRGLPLSPDKPGDVRPPICLGHKGGDSASVELVDELRRIMAQTYDLPLSDIWIDRPFNGGYITRRYGKPETPVIQIEFSRGFYMGSEVGKLNPSLSESELSKWSGRFIETLERLAHSRLFLK